MSSATNLQAVSSAIGEALNDFCGLRMTRLLGTTSIGATSLTVERSYGWGATGILSIDGVVYHYTANNDGSLAGIYYVQNGAQVAGTKVVHSDQALIIDISQSYSALDLVRQAIFSGTAVGDDLSALGRNLGVLRLPDLEGDDQFRAIVQALAYNPKGTLYGLTLAMTALVGAGNFTIYEDLVNAPCTVFITVPASIFLATVPQGHTYLTGPTTLKAVSGALSFTLPTETSPFLRVGSLTLHDDSYVASCRTTLLGSFTLPVPQYLGDTGTKPISWTGGGSESVANTFITTAVDGQVCQLTSAAGSYTAHPQVQSESQVTFEVLTCMPSGGGLPGAYAGIGGYILDGTREIAWSLANNGSTAFSLALVSGASLVSGPVVLNRGTYYEIGLVKNGTGTVQLLVNGLVVLTAAYTAFPTTSSPASAVYYWDAASSPRLKSFNVYCHTPTDYWSARGTSNGSVNTASPTTFTASTGPFLSSDVGKTLRLSGSAVKNAQGGNNNALMQVQTVPGSTSVTLASAVGTGVQVNAAQPTHLTVVGASQAFTFPDDLGKTITLSGSAVGNNGSFVITGLLDPITGANLATEYLTTLTSHTNSAVCAAASFVTESNLSYQLKPNFITETTLTWDLSDAGSVGVPTGTTYPITARQTLPFATGVYDVLIDTVLSAQILANESVQNAPGAVGPPAQFSYWPFYILDPYNYVEAYMSELVAAGVVIQFDFV